MIEKLTYVEEEKTKKAFHASDVFKTNLDLYFAFTGEPKTNPPSWNDTLKWGAGVGVEAQMLKILKMNKVVKEDYDQKLHGRIEIEREGIKIHGYIDAISTNGTPIEIKSINNKNSYDISGYENGYPRESYVGQLSVYMDALNVDRGYLFVASVDGLNYFWLECKRIKGRVFKCGNVKVDLDEEYKRWASLYNDHVLKKVPPDVNQYLYKYDVNTIDWRKVSKTDISKVRNGRKVLGDWQITWSPWKDRIVKLQGSTLGYTNEELQVILEKTDGYTTWKK
jgi:hypothetical protein